MESKKELINYIRKYNIKSENKQFKFNDNGDKILIFNELEKEYHNYSTNYLMNNSKICYIVCNKNGFCGLFTDKKGERKCY